MTDHQPTEAKNLDIYGHEELPWSRARDLLAVESGFVPFLGTVRPDGRPHSAPLGAFWHDGDVYFTSSPDARKARNLAENSSCTLSIRLEGIDVVLEGEATRVTDAETLDRVVAVFRAGGWPAEVEGDAFTAPYNAPSAGPPPWHLYRFSFHTAFGVASDDPHGATRWRFER